MNNPPDVEALRRRLEEVESTVARQRQLLRWCVIGIVVLLAAPSIGGLIGFCLLAAVVVGAIIWIVKRVLEWTGLSNRISSDPSMAGASFHPQS